MTPRPRSDDSLEALFQRYREQGDVSALAELFDFCAPGLLRLARRLAGPQRHDWADDALQETFLALVERPERFDSSQPLLPWLTSILIRRLRDLERKEARRPTAERIAQHRAVPEVSDPAQEVAGAELRSEVDRAVEELPESMRLVVQGKLSGTAATGDLARELGISPGSLRVRMHRALTRLRDRLPQSLLGLLALFSASERTLAATRAQTLQSSGLVLPSTVLPLTLGALLMSKKVALVLLAFLIGTASWLALRTSPVERDRLVEAGPDRMTPELSVPRDEEAASLSKVSEAPPERSAETSALSERTTLAVHATLMGTGEVLPDQQITLLYHGEDPLRPLSAQTDARGIARFEVEPERQIVSLRLLPAGGHCGANHRYLVALEPGEERDIELEAGRGATLSGRVLDRSGAFVPHAEVSGWCSRSDDFVPDYRVIADAEGRFSIDSLGTGFVLKASTPELACDLGLRGELLEGQTVEGLTLVVHQKSAVRGRVVNEIGLAIAGSEVVLRNGLRSTTSSDATSTPGVKTFHAGRARAWTDSEGGFVLEGLPDSKGRAGFFSHQMTISHPKYDELSNYSKGGGAEERDYVLLAPLTILGQVLDRHGRPAVGALVRGGPMVSSLGSDASRVKTDQEGRFLLKGLRHPNRSTRYNFSLRIVFEGHAVHVEEGFDPRDSQTKPLVIRLNEAQRSLRGRVVDGEGNPMAGVTMDVEGARICAGSRSIPPRTWERFCGLAETRTDGDGRFSFEKLYPGTFKLRAVDPRDEERVFEKPFLAGTDEIEIVMSGESLAPAMLTGTVRTARNGKAVQDFTIITSENGVGSRHEFTEADGEFEISGLSPGSYRITVDSSGFAPWVQSEQWLSRGKNFLACKLQPARSLEIQLAGENVTGTVFNVEPFDRRGNRVPFQSATSPSATSMQTAKGFAQLHRLPAEALVLHVSNPQYSQDFEIDLTDPVEGPLTLELGPFPGAQVWLRITEPSGGERSPFHLGFEGSDQGALAMVFTPKDSEGDVVVVQRFAYSQMNDVEDPAQPFFIRLPEGEVVLRSHGGASLGRVLQIETGLYTEKAPLEIDLSSL